jgi:hypothetical protein
MNIGLRQSLVVVAAAALLGVSAGSSASSIAPRDGLKCPHATGAGTTGDWEVAFGRRALRSNAVKLLRRVRAKGFRPAVIEREQCLFEAAVIGLHTRHAAVVIAVRAKRRGLVVSIVQS